MTMLPPPQSNPTSPPKIPRRVSRYLRDASLNIIHINIPASGKTHAYGFATAMFALLFLFFDLMYGFVSTPWQILDILFFFPLNLPFIFSIFGTYTFYRGTLASIKNDHAIWKAKHAIPDHIAIRPPKPINLPRHPDLPQAKNLASIAIVIAPCLLTGTYSLAKDFGPGDTAIGYFVAGFFMFCIGVIVYAHRLNTRYHESLPPLPKPPAAYPFDPIAYLEALELLQQYPALAPSPPPSPAIPSTHSPASASSPHTALAATATETTTAAADAETAPVPTPEPPAVPTATHIQYDERDHDDALRQSIKSKS